jgi:hypothetical protein
MNTPTLTDQAKHLESALRERILTYSNDPARAQVYLALAMQVQSVAERLAEIEPKPEYRMLEVGEVLQKDDEFHFTKSWEATAFGGERVLEGQEMCYRRRVIPAAEFQQLSDFYEKEVQS